MQFRNRLQTMKNGSMSIHEFMKKMQKVVDSLIANGQIIKQDESINCIVDDIIPKYDPHKSI